ncbi:M55 family metallopeptidase [Sphaerisporangium sp. NPDC051011]|uniref:M55 family metallopeptidase n=1 Tax=Sphaerisporangium sp. NPDC051011 TaxID=3155792 RepID=UPI0033FD5548
MDNLLHARLDPRARVTFGTPRAQCMVQGVDAETDVVLFVGYHAPAGCHGVLAHTYSGFTSVRVNGVEQSEASGNAIICAAHGVPVGMVTGDDVICAQARELFLSVEVVEVKQAEGFAQEPAPAISAAFSLMSIAVGQFAAGRR